MSKVWSFKKVRVDILLWRSRCKSLLLPPSFVIAAFYSSRERRKKAFGLGISEGIEGTIIELASELRTRLNAQETHLKFSIKIHLKSSDATHWMVYVRNNIEHFEQPHVITRSQRRSKKRWRNKLRINPSPGELPDPRDERRDPWGERVVRHPLERGIEGASLLHDRIHRRRLHRPRVHDHYDHPLRISSLALVSVRWPFGSVPIAMYVSK